MKYYFKLQSLRLKRKIEEFGFNPILLAIISLIIFVLLSLFLFQGIEYAVWIYCFIALYLAAMFGAKQRCDFLKIIFDKKLFRFIRIIENLIIVFPFAFYLLYEQNFIFAFGLLLASFLLALFEMRSSFNLVTPTPFKKFPFEFIVGFRQAFLLIAADYFLIFKAVQVDNYNLAAFSLAALYFTFMSFYMKAEKSYFVWIFKNTSKSFLTRKVVLAISCASIIVFPSLIILILVFPKMINASILIFIVGFLYLISAVFAKYSSFPRKMHLPQAILYAISLWFPPILLVITYIFYKKSNRNLQQILG